MGGFFMKNNPHDFFYPSFGRFSSLLEYKSSPKGYNFRSLLGLVDQLRSPEWFPTKEETQELNGILANHESKKSGDYFTDDEEDFLEDFFDMRGRLVLPVSDDGSLNLREGKLELDIGIMRNEWELFTPSFPIFEAFGECWRVGSYRNDSYDHQSFHGNLLYRFSKARNPLLSSLETYDSLNNYDAVTKRSYGEVYDAMRRGTIDTDTANRYVDFLKSPFLGDTLVEGMTIIDQFLPVLTHQNEIFKSDTPIMNANQQMLNSYRNISRVHVLVDEIYYRYLGFVWKSEENARELFDSYRKIMFHSGPQGSKSIAPEDLRAFTEAITKRLVSDPQELPNSRREPSEPEDHLFYVSEEDRAVSVEAENRSIRELVDELMVESLLLGELHA